MLKGVPDYRNSNYSIINTCGSNIPDTYRQCKVSHLGDHKLVWIDSIHVQLPDKFIEFKLSDGTWEGKDWRIIYISPPFTKQDLIILKQNPILIDKDDVRDFQLYNKG